MAGGFAAITGCVGAPYGSSATALPGTSAYGLFLAVNPSSAADVCALYQLYQAHSANWSSWWGQHLDGVTLLINWSDVASGYDNGSPTYTFAGPPVTCGKQQVAAGIDGLLSTSGSLQLIPPNVHLGIAVTAGNFTPSSLMQAPKQAPTAPTVDSMYFTFTPNKEKAMNSSVKCFQLPLPWETNFINAYENLLFAVKSNLKSLAEGSASRLGNLVLVHLTGINAPSEELIMPGGGSGTKTTDASPCDGTHKYIALNGQTVTPGVTGNDELWADEGYTSNLVETQAFDLIGPYARTLFSASNTTFALAVINGDPLKGTGGVAPDPTDNPVPDQISAPDFTRLLVGDLVGQTNTSNPVINSQDFAISFQALSPCAPQPASMSSAAGTLCNTWMNEPNKLGPVVQLNCEAAAGSPVFLNGMPLYYNKTQMAWETNEQSPIPGRADCGSNQATAASGCSGSDYETMLDNGIDNGARYIEVWTGDVAEFADTSNGGTDYIQQIHNYWQTKTQPSICSVANGG